MGLADVQVFEFFGGMMSINFGVRSKWGGHAIRIGSAPR